MDQEKTKKALFWGGFFSDLGPVLQSLDRERRIFTFLEHCLVFEFFKPLPSDFES